MKSQRSAEKVIDRQAGAEDETAGPGPAEAEHRPAGGAEEHHESAQDCGLIGVEVDPTAGGAQGERHNDRKNPRSHLRLLIKTCVGDKPIPTATDFATSHQ